MFSSRVGNRSQKLKVCLVDRFLVVLQLATCIPIPDEMFFFLFDLKRYESTSGGTKKTVKCGTRELECTRKIMPQVGMLLVGVT